MKKSVRQKSRRMPPWPEFHDIVFDLGESFQSAIITRAAILDVGLEMLIKTRMRTLSKDDHNALFSGAAPLAGFAAKIRIAYALGIIGPVTKKDLQIINELRNTVAHSSRRLSLRNERLWHKAKAMRSIQEFIGLTSWHGISLTRERKLLLAISLYLFDIKFLKPKRVFQAGPVRSGLGSSRSVELWGRLLRF